jgi:hypothetical protein
MERVTLLINGGRNGLDKRRALFNLAKRWCEVDMGLETIIGIAALSLLLSLVLSAGSFTRHQQSGSESRPAAHRRKGRGH